MLDFTYVEFPCSLDLNTFKAYFNVNNIKLPKVHGKNIQVNNCEAGLMESNANQVKSLRHMALDLLVENWEGMSGMSQGSKSHKDGCLVCCCVVQQLNTFFFGRQSCLQGNTTTAGP